MKQSRDQYYFDVLTRCAEHGCEAAKYLRESLADFDTATFTARMERMHAMEHEADILKHDMMEHLNREFMTPIEREDILALSQELDNVVDCIDDVMQRIYIHNVRTMRDDVPALTELVERCAIALRNAVAELHNFRKSATIRPAVVEVNSLESEGDALYLRAMRKLYTTGEDAIAVLSWTHVYEGLEYCLDACEHASDVIESVVMKNS